jgi:hypothetical protein
MTEIWKDIVGYEGLYKVSDSGRVLSVRRNSVLSPGRGRYLMVTLCKTGTKQEVSVHRLVAEAFCEKRDGATEVNHINENRYDNRAANLEWCTRLENIRHGTGIQRHADAQRNGGRSKRINQVSINGDLIASFPSIREMNRSTGYDRAAVHRCANGRQETAYGYKWQYAI